MNIKTFSLVGIVVIAAVAFGFGYPKYKTYKTQQAVTARENVVKNLDYATALSGSDGQGGKLTETEKAQALEGLTQSLAVHINTLPTEEAYVQASTVYFNLGKLDEAQAALVEGLEQFPDSTIIKEAQVSTKKAVEATSSVSSDTGVVVSPSSVLYSVEFDDNGNTITHQGGTQ
ncbi:MAG: hypothetical protein WC045_04170 [Patescibacteria group bacterium]